jgi:ABC-type molybdate transport system substrate-binding protein
VKPALALLAVAAATVACKRTPPAPPPPETRLVVVADATLRDAFTTMLTDFNWANRTVEVTFTFGDPTDLRAKLERGTAADVVALCNEGGVATLGRLGKVAAPIVFARDEKVKAQIPARADGGLGGIQVVSRTALRALGDGVKVTPLEDRARAISKCSIAQTLDAQHPVSAGAWVAYVQSSMGQQQLRDAGLLLP